MIPCGTPFGVKIFTQGVVVVGMSDLKSNGKTVNPARSAGLKIGDVITSINGIQVIQSEGGRGYHREERRRSFEPVGAAV